MPSLSAAIFATALGLSHGLTLHVKAGPDGRAIGDCPFAHAIRFAAAAKGLEMDVVPHSPTSKPSWLVEQYEGKMPCLVDDNQKVVTESRVITNHLEEIYPMPSLTDSPNLEAAEEAATPVFMAFARYCKNTDADNDDELKKALLLALCTLDAALSKTRPGPYSCGAVPSMADCFLLPALFHVSIAGKAFKEFEVPPQFESLHQYMDYAFATPLFAGCAPAPAMVRWGWANARGDEAAAAAAAAECGVMA